MAEKWHSGITMHKLSFGGGLMGLLFAAGSVVIFVLGFPTLWYFVALAFGLGVGVAAVLHLSNDSISRRNKPLSITEADPEKIAPSPAARTGRYSLQSVPQFASASGVARLTQEALGL